VSTLLAMGTGCVLASLSTTVAYDPHGPELEGPDGRRYGLFTDRSRAWVVARQGCDHVDVVLPPGARLIERRARVKLGDGGGHRLSDVRWQPLPRDLSGRARVRLHVPELLAGDRVKLDLTRQIAGESWDWTPGPDGAQQAELRLDKGLHVNALRLGRKKRDLWLNQADPQAWARVHPSADQAHDDAVRVFSLFDADQPTPETAPASPQLAQTPAELIASHSRQRLLPDRSDMASPTARGGLADHTITPGHFQRYLDEFTPLHPALIVDGDALHPIGRAAIDGGEPRRVWAHPDQRWQPTWRVVRDGQVHVPVGTPAGDGPVADDPVSIERTLALDLPDGADPATALVPGQGSHWTLTEQIRFSGPPDRTRVHLLTARPGARITQVDIQDESDAVRALRSVTGDQVLLIAGPHTEPGFTVVQRGADVPLCGPDPDVPTQLVTPARVQRDGSGWWIEAWGEQPLITDRARVLASLNARFNRRSLPEPGLPMRLRNRLAGWELAAELPDVLRERAVVAPLPGGDPLWPRRLHKARGTGVVSPVEAALITRLYAMQAKLDATWVLTRAQGAPQGPELCAPTYTHMLVKLTYQGETRWLDPACEACAPFQVRPELLGQPALGRGVDRTPEPVPGAFVLAVDGTRVGWHLEGPAALELRIWLRSLPVEGRAQALAERMAGPGATLQAVAGAKERGVPITASAIAADEDAMPDPAQVLLPERITWPGPRSLVRGTTRRTVEPERGSLDPQTRQALAAELHVEPTVQAQPSEPESPPEPETAEP